MYVTHVDRFWLASHEDFVRQICGHAGGLRIGIISCRTVVMYLGLTQGTTGVSEYAPAKTWTTPVHEVPKVQVQRAHLGTSSEHDG